MKLEDLTDSELKALGYDMFIRRSLAENEASEATRAINAIQSVLASRVPQAPLTETSGDRPRS